MKIDFVDTATLSAAQTQIKQGVDPGQNASEQGGENVEGRLLFFFFLGLLFLLQRDLLHANLWHAIYRISFFPAFCFHQLGKTFRAGHNVPHLHGTGFDFEALVDCHRIVVLRIFSKSGRDSVRTEPS